MKQRLQKWFRHLQHHSNRWWYPPLIGAMAFADLFILVVPTDGILVSAVAIAPHRWIYTGLMVALGSALGATALAHVLQVKGMPYLLHMVPGIEHTKTWLWTNDLMHKWGDWGVAAVAISPLPQHPAVALAAFAGISLFEILVAVFLGRAIKYLFLAWLASHSPKLLNRCWGIKHELKEVGFGEKDECGEAKTK